MAELALESFDVQQASVPAQTFEDGFEAGYALAKSEAEAEQSDQTAQMVASLAELSRQRSSAEEQVLASLSPLFDAIVERLLPAMALEAIGHQIVEVLQERAAGVSGLAGVLRLSPSDHLFVSAAITDAGLPVTMMADPSLGPGQAVLGDATGLEDFLDLTEVVTAIRVALEALSSTPSGDLIDE